MSVRIAINSLEPPINGCFQQGEHKVRIPFDHKEETTVPLWRATINNEDDLFAFIRALGFHVVFTIKQGEIVCYRLDDYV